MKKIRILSGDQRQFFAWKYLREQNYDAELISNFHLGDADIILACTPFVKLSEYVNCDFQSAFPVKTLIEMLHHDQTLFAGGIPETSSSLLLNKKIPYFDLLKDSNLLWQNAYLTAEALFGKIITQTDFSIRNINLLLMGFGRCGMNIAQIAHSFQSNVFVYDHHETNRARAVSFGYTAFSLEELPSFLPECDILINTVPKEILQPEHYEHIKKSCVLYDISSYPYGLNHDIAETNALTFNTCPGLPGKFTPKTAGELIAKKIIAHIERM